MKKIESGEGATALNVDVDKIDDHLKTGISHDPWPQPPHQSMNFWPTDPALARRVDDLEKRIKSLEDGE